MRKAKGEAIASPFLLAPMDCLFSGRHGNNRDNLAVFLGAAKLDLAMDRRKNRVILADADAGSGVPGGAALADDDVA